MLLGVSVQCSTSLMQNHGGPSLEIKISYSRPGPEKNYLQWKFSPFSLVCTLNGKQVSKHMQYAMYVVCCSDTHVIGFKPPACIHERTPSVSE